MWKILTARIRGEIFFSLEFGGLFPEKTQKGCRKGTREKITCNINRPIHPKKSKDIVENCSHDIDWLQKRLQYDATSLDNRIFENIQNTRQIHKLNHKRHVAQSVGAGEYTDCISAEGYDSPNECSGWETKQSDGEASVRLDIWGKQRTLFLP